MVIAAILIAIGIGAGAFFALAQPFAPTSNARPTASQAPSATLGSAPPTAPGTPGATPPASASASPAGGSARVAIESTLLSVLPASILGSPLVENRDGEEHDLTDPALAGEASALAAALVIDTSTGDFAYVSVVRLRPGVYSEAYFRSWRETFDAGACAQAGGVSQSSAEATIAGHRTFIGHCVGGILTYHVRLVQADLIVSISALGAQRFGQLVVEGLR